MQMRLFKIVPIAAAIAIGGLLCSNARADVVTFDALEVNPFTGSQTEGAFTYQVLQGSEWRIDSFSGNPASSLSTGFPNTPGTGDEVAFILTGGGLFTFDSVDFGLRPSDNGAQSDVIDLIGEVGGSTTQQLLGVSTTSSTFQTALSGFTAPIDRLIVRISSVESQPLELDNFVFTPVEASAVPEPASLTLLGIGIAGLAVCKCRSRKRIAA